MRFDGYSRFCRRKRFGDIGKYRPLCKPLYVGHLAGFGLEHLYKVSAYDFTFGFGVGYSAQIAQKFIACTNACNVQSHTLIGSHHLLVFTLAHQTRIDENTVQIRPDSPVQQHRRHRRIAPA